MNFSKEFLIKYELAIQQRKKDFYDKYGRNEIPEKFKGKVINRYKRFTKGDLCYHISSEDEQELIKIRQDIGYRFDN